MTLLEKLISKYPDKIKRTTYKKQDVIFEEGEKCSRIGIVERGQIEIHTITPQEKEYSIKTLSEGDMFGSIILFSGEPFFLGEAKVTKDTSVIYVSKKDLLYILQDDSEMLGMYLGMLSKNSLKMQKRIKVLSQSSIEDKVLFLFNSKFKDKDIFYFNTKEELAKYLNIPRPSLSRALISLKNKNKIEYGKHFIKLK